MSKKCSKCAEEIEDSAKKCKHCGSDLRSWPNRHPILTIVFLIVLIPTIIAVATDDKVKKETQSNVAPATVTPPQSVTAYQLSNAYNQNEVGADEMFKDKTVDVTGIIDSVGKDIMDTPYVALEGSSYIDIQCMFSKQTTDDLGSLKKGKTITLRGRVSSKLMNVLIRDCSIVK